MLDNFDLNYILKLSPQYLQMIRIQLLLLGNKTHPRSQSTFE